MYSFMEWYKYIYQILTSFSFLSKLRLSCAYVSVREAVTAAQLWCRKSPYRVSLRLGCAMPRLENSLCQPSRKWVPFLRRMGSAFHQLCPRYSGTLTPLVLVRFFLNFLLNYTLCHLLESPHGGDSNGMPQCIVSWNDIKYLKYSPASPFYLSFGYAVHM